MGAHRGITQPAVIVRSRTPPIQPRQGPSHRREIDRLSVPPEVHRAKPRNIASENESPLLPVPNSNGEIAVEVGETMLVPPRVSQQDKFMVGNSLIRDAEFRKQSCAVVKGQIADTQQSLAFKLGKRGAEMVPSR